MKIDLDRYYEHDTPLQDIDLKPVSGSGRYKHLFISDSVISLDVECTSFFINSKSQPILYDKHNPKMLTDPNDPDSEPLPKGCVLYHWQLMIDGNYFTGRTCKSFKKFLEAFKVALANKMIDTAIIYIHNLSYEFQTLLLNVFKEWKPGTVFARETHKPIYVSPDSKFEFRCSYQLSMLPLAELGKEVGVEKGKDFEYNELRTPLTKLTEEEKDYCYKDVLIMDKWLNRMRLKYGHMFEIPLTLTGETRVDLSELFKPLKDYTDLCWAMNKQNYWNFKVLMKTMHGGCVFASPPFKDITIDAVKTPMLMKDIASSYPWVLLSTKMPCEVFTKTMEQEKINEIMSNPDYCYIIEIVADKVITKIPPLFLSKTYLENGKNHKNKGVHVINGRVYEAERIQMTVTNIDFDLFRMCYNYENLQILDFRYAKTDYLPDDFCRFIVECYKNKTQFKGVEGKEALYSKSKMIINALYGIFAQKKIVPEILFDGENWSKENVDTHPDPDDPTGKKKITASDIYWEKLNSLLWGTTKSGKKYPKTLYTFPACGCFVTAAARRNLWYGIVGPDLIQPDGTTLHMPNAEHVIYCDTDSIKQEDWDYAELCFWYYNQRIMEQHKAIADRLGIDVSELSPKTPKGKPKPIGIFAEDGECTEFRTLGCKKYIYRDKEDGKLHMTLAGVPKSCVAELNDDINNFKEGMEFFPALHDDPLLSDLKQKLTPYYLNDQQPVIFPDGYYHTDRFGICLMPTPYKLRGSNDDIDAETFIEEILRLADENPMFSHLIKLREEIDNNDN